MDDTFQFFDPYYEGKKVSIDIRPNGLYTLGTGSQRWVEECLTECSISGKPVAWSLAPGRWFYYTDYPGTKEQWVDRWQAFWTLEVELGQTITDETRSLQHRGPVAGTDLIDETGGEWYANPEEENKMNGLAMFIVTTTKAGAELAELSQRAANKIGSILRGCLVTTQARRYAGEWHMLRFLISKPGLFPDAVKELDELLAFLKAEGVCVHMDER